MGTKKYMNHWRCQLCDWNSDRSADYPAHELVRQGFLTLISCTRPHGVGVDPCKGLMLLVGFVSELGGE